MQKQFVFTSQLPFFSNTLLHMIFALTSELFQQTSEQYLLAKIRHFRPKVYLLFTPLYFQRCVRTGIISVIMTLFYFRDFKEREKACDRNVIKAIIMLKAHNGFQHGSICRNTLVVYPSHSISLIRTQNVFTNFLVVFG